MKIKNQVRNTIDGFQVTYQGTKQSPFFNCRGAALAFLDGLTKGVRKPEPCHAV